MQKLRCFRSLRLWFRGERIGSQAHATVYYIYTMMDWLEYTKNYKTAKIKYPESPIPLNSGIDLKS